MHSLVLRKEKKKKLPKMSLLSCNCDDPDEGKGNGLRWAEILLGKSL